MGECQVGQGSGGSQIGELQQLEGKKKPTRVNQDLHMATLKSATQVFKNMNKSFAVKSIILCKDNDDALFSRLSRQLDMIFQGYFK